MTKRRRNLLSTVATFAIACLFLMPSGCKTHSPYSVGEHHDRRLESIKRDFVHVAWSLDRHFFNYDWDDPTLD